MRTIVTAGLGMLVAACASTQLQQLVPPQPIICIAGPDCQAKWTRAAAWIAANSKKVELRTDTVIQTPQAVPSETTAAFTVTKVARGEGRFEITFNGGCGNMYRCVPSIAESHARFTQFVLGDSAATAAESPATGR